MEINRALEQIDEIHGHLDRTEVYRGYRPIPVALGGVLAIVAGAVQPYLLSAAPPRAFVLLWVGVAALVVMLIGAEIVRECWVSGSSNFRRSTLRTLSQLLPCIVSGAVVTLVFTRSDGRLVPLLPGIWAILLGMGVLASRPYLPRTTGWVGLFYLFGGGVLLLAAESGASVGAWGMSTVFGTGQLFAALMLYRNLQRRADGKEEEADG